jgi:hypothetical protein
MDRIIKAVADETKSRGARRVTPSHLYGIFWDWANFFFSKQIISTQKQYDFLESLTSEIALPPSRPPTPPPGPRRRRKQSPTMSGALSSDAPKRKRRSPIKDKAHSAPSASPDFKSEMEDVKMENAEPEPADLNHTEQAEHAEERRRGWFDIVMGGNEHDSSEDETFNKRRYAKVNRG